MTTVRIRGHITITVANGILTTEAATTAWATAGPIPAGCPIDLHITGPVTFVQPGALHPLGCHLVDAPEVIVHANTTVPLALDEAVHAAIAAENRFRGETLGGAA